MAGDGECLCNVHVNVVVVLAHQPSILDKGLFQSKSTNGYKYHFTDGTCCFAVTYFRCGKTNPDTYLLFESTLSMVTVRPWLAETKSDCESRPS